MSASPESFSRILLKRGRIMRCQESLDAAKAAPPLWRSRRVANCQAAAVGLSDRLRRVGARSRGHFSGEVFLLPFDAFAELAPDERRELDARAGVLCSGGDNLRNRRLVVHDEQLREERVLLAELGEITLDHFLDDVLRLAAFLRLFNGDRALTLNEFGREFFGRQCEWMGGRDVHRDLLAKLRQRFGWRCALERDQHADLAQPRSYLVVDVRHDGALPHFNHGSAAERLVLANLGDVVSQLLLDSAAVRVLSSAKALDIRAVLQRELRDVADECLENLVLR